MTHPTRGGDRIPQPTRAPLRPTDVLGAFFLCAIAFLAAAAVAAIVQSAAPWPGGRWLALHLAFVGGVSQLVLGASQFFSGAFLATDPPPRTLVRGQLIAWNAGAILLAIAVPGHADAQIWVAAALLLCGLALWTAAIVTLRRNSLRSFPWATRWYLAATAFFSIGIPAGALMASGVPWPHGDLLSAHMVLNLAGWLGATIVGTLHTFYPSLTQTRLRYPRLQIAAFAAWTSGVAMLATGYGLAVAPATVAGWLGLCLGALALLVNVTASQLAAPRPLSFAARVVGAAQPFLLAAVALAAAAAIGDGATLTGSTRATVGTLLVTGWIGLTVLGSLLHLLAVLIRVRGGLGATMPAPNPRHDAAVTTLAMAGIAASALSQGAGLDGWRAPAAALLLAAYLILAARITTLAGRILLHIRPSV